ncbi:helix-turn-helix domain-containing protein [Paenibacillus melissococcoides]|uniref:Helix-turn-helix domain-containing protein n=1 Tax=Paenibacillus melissococcoides TaxID=2912268 RepID=A0ABM9GAE3_9BACL|nr:MULTISPECIES: helix-turn-helix domain-containing protein [Paenibacillus]MEB9896682.1 helix-turn-helix domain-containing protein [Bacillus cereus]QVQ56189.1 helix-turn-helix domain-containing protein [Paenibacillus phage Pd_22F]CAH8248766.1 helix-turn-helix domain-containing protein [Paenibacillus melissococcoides]CAH8713794.1 helix-turn-helix domain-containing protein [Paenibacillus melissococcoides]CAH8720439.1 helix-turn-helix domain-containing protein [Paenibacillus melissococcoides]
MRTIDEIIKDMQALGTSPETIDRDIAELEDEVSQWVNKAQRGKLTLRDARQNMRMSYEEVSERTGVSVKRLKRYEEDSRRMPHQLMVVFSGLYRLSVNHLYFGVTPSTENKNHLNLSLAGR